MLEQSSVLSSQGSEKGQLSKTENFLIKTVLHQPKNIEKTLVLPHPYEQTARTSCMLASQPTHSLGCCRDDSVGNWNSKPPWCPWTPPGGARSPVPTQQGKGSPIPTQWKKDSPLPASEVVSKEASWGVKSKVTAHCQCRPLWGAETKHSYLDQDKTASREIYCAARSTSPA